MPVTKIRAAGKITHIFKSIEPGKSLFPANRRRMTAGGRASMNKLTGQPVEQMIQFRHAWRFAEHGVHSRYDGGIILER
jgi:hypothetical protein